MKMQLRHLPLVFFAVILPGIIKNPTAQEIPPGVPERGLVTWGAVANVNNPSQPIAITSVSWTVSDGTKPAVYNATSKPATQIVSLSGRSYYVLEVPFDTRTFGNVSLADPASVGINSFELKSANPPTYTLTPTINGILATVRSIDGAPASGANFPVTGFSAAIRGRVLRVDLAISPPPADPYEVWVIANFGSATALDAARTADPDKDGFGNEAEYLAGTNPKDAASVLRILTITAGQGQTQVSIGWQSVSTKKYRVEAASNVNGPWTEVGAEVTSSGTTAQTALGRTPSDQNLFYRVRVVP